MREFVELAGNGAEIAGVMRIIGGLVFASVHYLRKPAPADESRYKRYRHDL
jgi:hypothetical protein